MRNAPAVLVVEDGLERPVNKRRNVMTDASIGYQKETFLRYDVSDEAIEAAVGNVIAGNYTLAACTGLSVCEG